MKFAKTHTIASVVGIVTSANANGIRNESVPNVKMRISSAIGSAIELATDEVLAEHGVEVVLDRRLSREEDRRAGDRADRRAHVVRVALRVGRLEVGDDLGDRHVLRDGQRR